MDLLDEQAIDAVHRLVNLELRERRGYLAEDFIDGIVVTPDGLGNVKHEA